MSQGLNILVVAPMESEAKNFKQALSTIEHSNSYKVIQTGVGKVNAAYNTALELYGNVRKSYDLVAVIGYAGASSRLEQGSFVAPCCAKYHDVVVPNSLNTELVEDLVTTYPLQGFDDVIILTGDSFVTKSNVSKINSHLGNFSAALYDMESAAVCQVAENIPVVVLKIVSDNPQKDSNLQSFSEFVETHSNFSQFVHFLESLNKY